MIRGLLLAQGVPAPVAEVAVSAVAEIEPKVVKKVKRKASKYQKELGKQLEKLKQKHPRTAMKDLMARAHRATRKELKMK